MIAAGLLGHATLLDSLGTLRTAFADFGCCFWRVFCYVFGWSSLFGLRTVAKSSFCSFGVVAQGSVMELRFLEVGLVVFHCV